MRRLSLTTWSLHSSLGAPPITKALPTEDGPKIDTGANLQLIDILRQMQEHGISTLEICHFHLPSVAPRYLSELRRVADDVGVEIFSLLIDTGDISSAAPSEREADLRLIKRWMDVAAALGASAVRVVAGEAAPEDEAALDRSISALRVLARYGQERGLRVLTENFRSLASTANNCLRILDALDGAVGLCADVGNFPADTRVAQFRSVVERASSIHCWASYTDGGEIDPAQLRECLEASAAARFDGPYTLAYSRPGDPWPGIDEMVEIVRPYTAS